MLTRSVVKIWESGIFWSQAYNDPIITKMHRADPGGGGVHDLRMDGGLPPVFQKGTLF